MTAQEYNRLVSDATGWRGTYPMIVTMKVGDYYELGSDDVPRYLGNARNWPGWTDDVLAVESMEFAGSQTHSRACKRHMKASAGAEAEILGGIGAKATFSLEFTHAAGFVLAHSKGKHHRFKDVDSVRKAIVQSARAGWWQRNWILVTEVVAVDSATLVVATETGASIDLHANATIPDAIAEVAIAKPDLGWTASSWRGDGYSSICVAGTPLYHCLRVRRTMLDRLLGRDFQPQLLGPRERDKYLTDDPFDPDDDAT